MIIVWIFYNLKRQRSCRFYIWTASSEFGTYRLCEQRRFRRACASAQSRQNLRCSLIQAVSQARSLAPLNGWACAVKIYHDGMLEDTNSLDGAHIFEVNSWILFMSSPLFFAWWRSSNWVQESGLKVQRGLSDNNGHIMEWRNLDRKRKYGMLVCVFTANSCVLLCLIWMWILWMLSKVATTSQRLDLMRAWLLYRQDFLFINK